MIKIHVLHCGSVYLDKAIPFFSKTLIPAPFVSFFRNKKIWIPISVYLIEHPMGLVLIDTGWHEQVRTEPKKHLGLLHYLAGKPALPDGQSVTEQLERLGFEPSDIDYLVLSHLHDDHVSGLALVSDAQHILVSDMELEAASKDKLSYNHSMWRGIPLDTFQFQPNHLGPKERSFDLFGDGSILFVHTPGHTPGLVSTLIQGKEQFVLLSSDVAYSKQAFQDLVIPGITTDKDAALESVRWVKKMSESLNCLELVVNHDPKEKQRTIELR